MVSVPARGAGWGGAHHERGGPGRLRGRRPDDHSEGESDGGRGLAGHATVRKNIKDSWWCTCAIQVSPLCRSVRPVRPLPAGGDSRWPPACWPWRRVSGIGPPAPPRGCRRPAPPSIARRCASSTGASRRSRWACSATPAISSCGRASWRHASRPCTAIWPSPAWGVGDDEGAAAALETAQALAPDSAAVAFLRGQLASFSGRSAAAIAEYRRAAGLDVDHQRARFALAQEIERSGAEADLPEARQWLEEVLERRPDNLAVLLERARWAARMDDGDVLGDTIERLTGLSGAWPELAPDAVGRTVRRGCRGRRGPGRHHGAVAPQRAGPHPGLPRGPGRGQRQRRADRGAAGALSGDALAPGDRGGAATRRSPTWRRRWWPRRASPGRSRSR